MKNEHILYFIYYKFSKKSKNTVLIFLNVSTTYLSLASIFEAGCSFYLVIKILIFKQVKRIFVFEFTKIKNAYFSTYLQSFKQSYKVIQILSSLEIHCCLLRLLFPRLSPWFSHILIKQNNSYLNFQNVVNKLEIKALSPF